MRMLPGGNVHGYSRGLVCTCAAATDLVSRMVKGHKRSNLPCPIIIIIIIIIIIFYSAHTDVDI